VTSYNNTLPLGECVVSGQWCCQWCGELSVVSGENVTFDTGMRNDVRGGVERRDK